MTECAGLNRLERCRHKVYMHLENCILFMLLACVTFTEDDIIFLHERNMDFVFLDFEERRV